jgi:hypothetical protein
VLWLLTRRGANITFVRWSIPRITHTLPAARFSVDFSTAKSLRFSRAFWSGKKLSRQEIEELRRILDGKQQ